MGVTHSCSTSRNAVRKGKREGGRKENIGPRKRLGTGAGRERAGTRASHPITTRQPDAPRACKLRN